MTTCTPLQFRTQSLIDLHESPVTTLDEVNRSRWTSDCSMEVGENRDISDNYWTSANETFGLEWLFIDQKICPDKAKIYPKRTAKTGAQNEVKVTPRKRKACSLPREQTIPTKTTCHRGNQTRNRAHNLGARPEKTRERCK